MRNSTWKQGPHENIDFRDSYFSETHCILIKQANHKRKEKVPSLFFHCNIKMVKIFNKMWFSMKLLSVFGEDAFKL